MKRLKLTWKEKLLFIFPFLILLWPVAAALRQELRQDALDEAMRKMAGPNAIDCGVSEFGANGPVARRAFASYKVGKPFLARFNYSPDDSAGMVMTSQGQSYSLMHKRALWLSRGKIYRMIRIKKLTVDTMGIRKIEGDAVSSAEQSKLLNGE